MRPARTRGGAPAALLAVAVAAAWAPSAAALDLDEAGTVRVFGRVYSQAAIRTADSFGWTLPSTPAGKLVQHRNLVEAEVAHALDDWLPARPAWVYDTGYRVRFKGVYEGIYDYGPGAFSEQTETNPPSPFDPAAAPESRTVNRTRVLRHVLGHQEELWNAYAQASLGDVFLRIGRQDLSWGETDGFRLLDMIEPLDGRFGFPLVEDLDDRRIPLWMGRATVAVPLRTEAVSNVALDTYFVPGPVEDREAPIAPRGSPFAAPAAPSFFERRVTRPGSRWEDSRGGGRLLFTLFGEATMSVAHYVTWNDSPATRLRIGRVDLVGERPVARPALEFVFFRQQVTGGSFTQHLRPPVDTVVRAEAAMFWNERVFDPLRAGGGPAFPALVSRAIADRLAGGAGEAAGGFTKREVFRWVFGLDKILWIRPLNELNTFTFSTQLFHTRILDHDDSIVTGIAEPGGTDFVTREQDEFTATLLVNTLYWRGRLQPSVFAAYDPRGVVAAVPGITWLVGTHVRITAKYAFVDGRFAGLGFFRDRDEALLRFEVSL